MFKDLGIFFIGLLAVVGVISLGFVIYIGIRAIYDIVDQVLDKSEVDSDD